ncbi:MAG: hypothetical protein KAY37_04710 [Phycisphaerae bacterium]|nr:hypothetical protein [Phycisphaerae bacterium]
MNVRCVIVGLVLAAMSFAVGCERKPTPPPTLPPTIPLNVIVVREVSDSGSPQDRCGYAYVDSQITTFVNALISDSVMIAGSKIDFVWSGNISTWYFQDSSGHWWAPYWGEQGWVALLSTLDQHYQEGAINIFFVPGIIDSSDPDKFMDSYTIDPAANGETGWVSWWKPMCIISDCWVRPNCTGGIIGDPYWQWHPQRLIPPSVQQQKLILHHAIGRYLLRQENAEDWDNQERWVGEGTNYMQWWNPRNRGGILQNEILQRIQSGNWNNP